MHSINSSGKIEEFVIIISLICRVIDHGLWSQSKLLSQLFHFLAVSVWESLWTSLSVSFFKGWL